MLAVPAKGFVINIAAGDNIKVTTRLNYAASVVYTPASVYCQGCLRQDDAFVQDTSGARIFVRRLWLRPQPVDPRSVHVEHAGNDQKASGNRFLLSQALSSYFSGCRLTIAVSAGR